MHHHLFPSEDTYVTNLAGYSDKNFGINEVLRIGTSNSGAKVLKTTRDFSYVNVVWNDHCVTDFTGILSGSFDGSADTANGTVSYSASFTSSYFIGSVNGGPIAEVSGSVSGSVSGIITGSLISAILLDFSGSLTGSSGHITGLVSGTDTINDNHWVVTTTKFVDRTFIKFDLSTISAALANGEIVDPRFSLNLKVCNEYDLPIQYKIYAFPISQSWVMGNGYYSDGGSDTGASWFYKDYADGTPWYAPITTSLRPVVDFLNDPNNATASFAYGGGTWYYTDANTSSSMATQSFNYESADIRMDVTNIVMSWISGSLPNNGFILMSSDEVVNSGSGFDLTFYGRDTNSINSPYLDVMWSDFVYETGSVFTSSVVTVTIPPGISASIVLGGIGPGFGEGSSSIYLPGGISGSFSGSSFINTYTNYVTASEAVVTNRYVTAFTGSLTGSFVGTASYSLGTISGSGLSFYTDNFTGDIDGVTTSSISSSISGGINGSVTGSIYSVGSFGFFSGSLESPVITLTGQVSGFYLDSLFYGFTGFISGQGLTGNVANVPVFGNVIGMVRIDSVMLAYPSDIITLYPSSPYNEFPYTTGYQILYPGSPYNSFVSTWYTWMGDTWVSDIPALPTYPITTSCGIMHNVQTMIGTFLSGPWSSSHFVAYYSGYGIPFGTLSGSLTDAALSGASVTIPIPSGIDPYAYAYVTGPFVNGTALGLYTIYTYISASVTQSSSTSASFSGQFINGNLLGAYLTLQLTGSVYTSSYTYSSSSISSSVFAPLDTNSSFTVIVKNLKPEYKGGDIPRVTVFGRKEFPLKTFGKVSQQTEYIVPELLPTTSYYAIKDNMSEEMIIDFDNYTRISCEYPKGNYFMLDTSGLAQERPYRVLVRIENSGSKYTFDNGDVFKITR